MASPSFLKVRSSDADPSRVQDNVNQTLQPIATALNATPIMGAPPPSWVRPALVGGFTNVGGAQALLAYHRDALGYVHLKGALTNTAGCAANTVITDLPAGYRPSELLRFAVAGTAGAQLVSVAPNGAVTVLLVVAAAGLVGLQFSFLAER